MTDEFAQAQQEGLSGEEAHEDSQNSERQFAAFRDYYSCGRDRNSEIVIGLVGALGTDLPELARRMGEQLKLRGYSTEIYRISRDVIQRFYKDSAEDLSDEYARIIWNMDAGDRARRIHGDDILALRTVHRILDHRKRRTEESECDQRLDLDDNRRSLQRLRRTAHIVLSLKHPEEVMAFRRIYGDGFYLLGAFSDESLRARHLTRDKGIEPTKASALMKRDEKGEDKFGQDTRGTFQLSDFFMHLDGNRDGEVAGLNRVLDLVFGHPNVTPTFDEYAMFMAFAASLRSADLSRQVGAVVADEEHREILATGANDCPRFGGGLYWPERDAKTGEISDENHGRDYTQGADRNAELRNETIDEIVESAAGVLGPISDDEEAVFRSKLRETSVGDISEYGRAVHAEMEAVLACGRNGLSSRGATVYCTTFPCHNCAKHIVAAGIKRVVYVEPYPKSKALELHSDAVTDAAEEGIEKSEKVRFEPFEGVGPRRFFDLFSMRHGSGYPMERKDRSTGRAKEYDRSCADVRTPILPWNYIEREGLAAAVILARERRP